VHLQREAIDLRPENAFDQQVKATGGIRCNRELFGLVVGCDGERVPAGADLAGRDQASDAVRTVSAVDAPLGV
jgi:hypothetical protein